MKQKSKLIRIGPFAARFIAEWAQLTGKSETYITTEILNAFFTETEVPRSRVIEHFKSLSEVEKERRLAKTRIGLAISKVKPIIPPTAPGGLAKGHPTNIAPPPQKFDSDSPSHPGPCTLRNSGIGGGPTLPPPAVAV
jgi:hypothetical protein